MVCNHGIFSSCSLALSVRDSGSLSPYELNIASDLNIITGIIFWSSKKRNNSILSVLIRITSVKGFKS